MLKWEAWNRKKEVAALYLLQITRFRWSGNFIKNWCQKSSKMITKSKLGRSLVLLLRFVEAFEDFVIGKKFANNQKNRDSDANKNIDVGFWRGGRRQRRGPRRAFGVCKSVRYVRVCKSISDALSPASRGWRIWVRHAARAPPPPHFVNRRFGACVCCSCWRFAKR